MSEDAELLGRYLADRSETAFAELIRRNVDLVYSAANRLMNGDAHRAQDVTQQVFAELARSARRLSAHPALTGWLYTTTRRTALNALRTEVRRNAREREVTTMNALVQETAVEPDWETIRPVLEAAMHELGETDRLAVLLRFFKNRSLRDVGGELGLTENAARMRVERALEKLRIRLARKGITSTAAALALALAGNAVTAAPAGFAATLAAASLNTAATVAGTSLMMKIMTATKVKWAVGALVTAGAATALVMQHQTQDTLRAENDSLSRRFTQLQTDYEGLSNRLASNGSATRLADAQLNELMRLRAEVAAFQAQKASPPFKQSNVRQAATNGINPVLPVVLEAPTIPLTPPAGWSNHGNATPADAIQTLYWALSHHDADTFSSLIAWGGDARTNAEALFQHAPEAVQQHYGSIDGVVYAMLSALPPMSGFAVVSDNPNGDQDVLVEQHQYEDGRVRQNQVTLYHFNDGWRVVFGDPLAMRLFDNTLRSAATSVGAGK